MASKPKNTKESTELKHQFLTAIERGSTVKDAAAAIGVHRRTLYDWKDRDAGFARSWEHALSDYQDNLVDELEQEAKHRALDRNDKYSHILLMFVLKRWRPEYREAYKSELTVRHEEVATIDFSSKDLDDAIEILQGAKKGAPSTEV